MPGRRIPHCVSSVLWYVAHMTRHVKSPDATDDAVTTDHHDVEQVLVKFISLLVVMHRTL